MSDEQLFVDAFVAALSRESRQALMGPALEQLLRARFAAARRAWPDLAVDAATFGRFVAERAPSGAETPAAIAELHIEELWLTCACSRGDGRAMRRLEERYFPFLSASLVRIGLDASRAEEIKQQLRGRLFVVDGARRAMVANYAGRGDLGSWLCIAAVRAGHKLLRRQRREIPAGDDRLAALTRPDGDAEQLYEKSSCRKLFREAFYQAWGELEQGQKNLLRQHYLQGLTIDEMAALHQIHRATAARWLAVARRSLADATRAALMRRANTSLSECQSIIDAADHQAELTFHRLLVD